jgi:hypothetical protein
MTELEALRVEVAVAHGLGMNAAAFLDGATVEEIEAQAVNLARLVAAERKEEQPHPLALALDPAERARRKRQLTELFTTGPRQARDERGRFASRGFDGGARMSLPVRKSPEQAHDELIVQLAGLSRTFGGGQSL